MRRLFLVGAALAIGTGCGGTAQSSGGMHEQSGTGGFRDTDPGAPAGGNALGGEGGTEGGDAGKGGEAGYDDVGAAGYPDGASGIPDIGNCIADLSGTHADAISVHGHAGVLGDVDYTIWGFSVGSGSLQGIALRFTSMGQKGSPSGISGTHLTARTPTHDVVEGQIYHRDPEQLELEINDESPITTGVSNISCMDAAATGSFAFIRLSNPDTVGVYELDCPGSDIQVHGCFYSSN